MTTPTTSPLTIAVLGATGTVGSRVTGEAVARGHRVLALSRTPAPGHPHVTPVPVDAHDPHAVREALTGPPAKADAVVMTLRTEPVDQDFLVAPTRAVLDSAARCGIPVLVVGGAGALRSPDDPDLPLADNLTHVPAEYRPVAVAGIAQLRVCQAHTAARWTYLSPPAHLGPGRRTGRYRRGDTLLTGPDGRSWISVEDLVVAVVDELETPGSDRHFTVAATHAATKGVDAGSVSPPE